MIGVAIFRQRRNLCAIGSTVAYVVYGMIVLRMVGAGYYKRPSHEDFMLTAEFWIGLVLMVLALVVTLGLHKKILQFLRMKVFK